MAYDQTGTTRLAVFVAVLDEADRGRVLMAERAGLGTRTLAEPMDADLVDAGMTLQVINRDKNEVIDTITVSWALWDSLVTEAKLNEVLSEVTGCSTELADALKSSLNEVENLYVHDECGTEWTDTYSCEVDTDCPCCQRDIQPARSDWKQQVDDDSAGVWRLYREDGLGDKDEAQAHQSPGLS